jgi:hypothetical protein
MNQQEREVIKQAFEMLWDNHHLVADNEKHAYVMLHLEVIEKVKALLEQPEPVQEPVAWMDASGDIYKHEPWPDWNPPHKPLYTTPPAQPAVPLTDEQANLLINGRGDEGDDDYVEPTGDGFGLTDEDLVKLIRRVEEHHGIKKGGA